jgi:hypothetical protein
MNYSKRKKTMSEIQFTVEFQQTLAESAAKAQKVVNHGDKVLKTAVEHGHISVDQAIILIDMVNNLPTVETILAKFVDAIEETCVTTREMVWLAMGDAFLTPEEHQFLMAGEWR